MSFLGLAVAAIDLHAQGSLTFQNTLGVGKEKYVFLPDPTNPTVAKYGGSFSDYEGFGRVAGTGYTAELWYGVGQNLSETSLRPIRGSQVSFRTGATAGLINGKSKLDIDGTFGGDWVTLQLRVWNNEGGTISDWEHATERGASRPFNHVLAGLAPDGSPQLGTGSIFNGISHFSLTVPEPSGLFALGFGLVLMSAGRLRQAMRSQRPRA